MLLSFYGSFQIDVGMGMPQCDSVIVYDKCGIYKHVPKCELFSSCRGHGASCNISECVCNFLGSLGQIPNNKILIVKDGCLDVIDKSALIPKDTDSKFGVDAGDAPGYGEVKLIGKTPYIRINKIGPAGNRQLEVEYLGPTSYLALTDTPDDFTACQSPTGCGPTLEFLEDINIMPYVKVDGVNQKLSHICEGKYFAIRTKSAETNISFNPVHEVGQRGMRFLDIPLDGGNYASHDCMIECNNFIKLPKTGPWLIGMHANVRVRRGVESFRMHPFAYRDGKIITLADCDPGGGDRMMAWPHAGLGTPFMADTDPVRGTDYVYHTTKLIRGREGDLIGLGSKMNCQNYGSSNSHPNSVTIRFDNFNQSGTDISRQDVCDVATGTAVYNQDDEGLSNMCFLYAIYMGN